MNMDDPSPLPSIISLEPHYEARQKACAKSYILAGTSIIQVKALMTSLLLSEKGRRCDYCLRQPVEGTRLSRCSGCAEFWYCGITCQKVQWEQHHRKLCKRYNAYLASASYQVLNTADRVESILLSQLIAAIFPAQEYSIPQAGLSSPISVFFDLLKGPTATRRSLPLCGSSVVNNTPAHVVEETYSRFGNNNFLVHSHLNTCAHGIFPLASRLFNHSCDPNCVAKYHFTNGQSVIMEIVAIRDIAEGDELSIPYLDPALPLQTRQEALSVNYGFRCICRLCTFQTSITPLPPLSNSSAAQQKLGSKLCAFVDAHMYPLVPQGMSSYSNADTSRWELPKHLHALLNADYLPGLSEEFSQASHEGEYDKALACGRTLLALYLVLYPMHYPQIGMHALELTKTAWNAVVTSEQKQNVSVDEIAQYENIARHYLAIASNVLELYGPEGDTYGPLDELQVMRSSLVA